MDVSGHFCFCPFPSQRGSPAIFLFFSLHQVNFVVDMIKRKEQFKAAGSSDWQHSIAPESLSTKVLFHCLKNMCMFKAHSLSLERVVFSLRGSDVFDNVNFQWFLIITCA